MKSTIVLNRSRRATHVEIRLLVLRTPQETVRHLCGPILIRRKTDTCRARIPLVRIKVVTILVRLAPIEDRSFQFEPSISEAGREYAKTDVGRVLQVMRERGRWILRSRSAMHERHRPQRGLAGITNICEPSPSIAQRQSVLRGQFHEKIVRMLPND